MVKTLNRKTLLFLSEAGLTTTKMLLMVFQQLLTNFLQNLTYEYDMVQHLTFSLLNNACITRVTFSIVPERKKWPRTNIIYCMTCLVLMVHISSYASFFLMIYISSVVRV